MALINEYPGHKISALTFVENPLRESIVVTGSTDQLSSNRIQVWLKHDNDISCIHEDAVEGDVHSITYIEDGLLGMTSSKGSLVVYHLNNHELAQVSECIVSKGPATDVIFHEISKDIVASGEDGSISTVNLSRLSDNATKRPFSTTPLTCLESHGDNYILTGNTAGHVKLIDLRSWKTEMSLPNNLNSVSVLRSNPGSHHYVLAGYQSGSIGVWDLRNSNESLPIEMTTHEASITGLEFIESNTLISSSLDGYLLKWTLAATSTAEKVEPLIRPISHSGPAITCFTHHRSSSGNEIAFANDREVLCIMTY